MLLYRCPEPTYPHREATFTDTLNPLTLIEKQLWHFSTGIGNNDSCPGLQLIGLSGEGDQAQKRRGEEIKERRNCQYASPIKDLSGKRSPL